jgi:hypothetical protein
VVVFAVVFRVVVGFAVVFRVVSFVVILKVVVGFVVVFKVVGFLVVFRMVVGLVVVFKVVVGFIVVVLRVVDRKVVFLSVVCPYCFIQMQISFVIQIIEAGRISISNYTVNGTYRTWSIRDDGKQDKYRDHFHSIHEKYSEN